MRIIFSRKGFDSQYGRVPSPILPDGSLLSFPIPSRYGRPLGDLECALGPVDKLASDLTKGAITEHSSVHLDPDLSASAVERKPGWRATLGQVGSAQRHLANQSVGPGDVFLFFGWFRQTELAAGKLQYVRGAPDIHALFGWLQVGEVLEVGTFGCPAWLEDHPHVQHASVIGKNNTLYVAGDSLSGMRDRVPAAGTFRNWGPSLQLTAPGHTRSIWRLPRWTLNDPSRPTLSYHPKPARWLAEQDHVTLQTVGKGQEFVIDVGECQDAAKWLQRLILDHGI
ncbi:Nmad3 family putative nucleotide modification protein [Ralstonia flatus]|uniref:Nucleotide modification associated domain-containing protein n=1 Tax=Ralstonia flatus TaxID=3058601 RepID=A0AAD2CBK1_9RALS|nr:hypothetical protein [Ralstonia sp. LMG 32965]MBN6206925.1 hypothetical protein [Ralstonia pickettii]CAJ0896550.1 hypothetical protein R77567_04736 [Ralstonia sp. LMG 32965]CAJ0904728.1 hypothetical protein R77564_05159 [Ralstonia sp. LMG 32965]